MGNEAIKLRLINLRDRTSALKHFTQRISEIVSEGTVPTEQLDKLCINLARINYLGKTKRQVNEIIVETLELIGRTSEEVSAGLLDSMEGRITYVSRIKRLWPIFATIVIQFVMRSF